MLRRSTKPLGPLLWLVSRSRHFWMTAALLALPVLYVLSIGPAMWVCLHTSPTSRAARSIVWLYSPIGWIKSCGGYHVGLAERSPEPMRSALVGYLNLWGWKQPYM